MVDAVGFAVTLAFLAAGAAMHAYADARPVASREALRLALTALVSANAVGAAFFAFRMLDRNLLVGTIAAFAVAAVPPAARLGTIVALRRQESRLRALGGAAPDWEPGGGEAGTAAIAMPDEPADGAIDVAADALVVLVGAAGCGKSTFAAHNFSDSQVVSSDECRRAVADDPEKASGDAFRLMYQLIGMRLKRGRLTVADATNVTSDKRAELLAIARQYERPAVAVVFELPEDVCRERNDARTGRRVPLPAIRGQLRHLRDALPGLAEEGFAAVHVLRTAAEVDEARIRVASGDAASPEPAT